MFDNWLLVVRDPHGYYLVSAHPSREAAEGVANQFRKALGFLALVIDLDELVKTATGK